LKYAVVSDIHGNLEALNAVLAKISPGDGLLCLGDIVGYGPNPNECVALIRERATACILGNHDVAAVDGHGMKYFNPFALEAMIWTQKVLSAENRTWLDSLGYELRMPDYLMVHGAPVNYFAYIMDKTGAALAFHATDAPLILIGHTHIAEYYALDPDGTVEHRHMQYGGKLSLQSGKRYLINVGSVGQPRDLNPDASFALYDSEEKTVIWERVGYAIARVQEKICEAHLPEVLATRLTAGR
jgi:diadenosine tetraphosphatase ApaH/serine/threonine PP2A family protein phosphatase